MGWMFAAGSLEYALEIKDGLRSAHDVIRTRNRLNWLQISQPRDLISLIRILSVMH